MKTLHPITCRVPFIPFLLVFAATVSCCAAQFTRLEPLNGVKITSSSEAYPGGGHNVSNLLDGKPGTEYSSNGKGVGTFVEFSFGGAARIAGFRHVDRNDPATIAESELTLLDESGAVVQKLSMKHPNQRAGVAFVPLSAPVTASRARWEVTKLGAGHGTVGGAEVTFLTVAQVAAVPSALACEPKSRQLLMRQQNGPVQPLSLALSFPYLETAEAVVSVPGAAPKTTTLSFGSQALDLEIPAVQAARDLSVQVAIGSFTTNFVARVKPVRPMEVYLLPHSHVDIGYTALQADVVKKQDENIDIGMKLIKATTEYPEDARFKWNVEVLWPVDNYLRKASPEKRHAFLAAIRSGQVGLDAFYGNILTGLCRPEELLRLMSYATRLSELCGVPVESAMISDVPGYTWSTVSAMAHAGVKYFSFAPNYFDRMGGTMKEWQNKPFWWEGPDGKSRVLCWCPSRGYALGHLIGDGAALARFMPEYLAELEANSYPFDITHLRWNVHGDNGSPDEKLSDVVKDWNQRYVYPRLIITTTAKAFRAFEARYGSRLPVYRGDYTPYWEDGAGSSALETAMNRASAERLVQAETVWGLRNPGQFPAAEFNEAWRNILLYSEHTWGAHNSISQPDLPFVLDQWKVKRAFAVDADSQSRKLLKQALTQTAGAVDPAAAIDVFNTSSWERTDLVTLSTDLATAGDRVLDSRGKPVPSQRLSTGELVFLARDLPPFSATRFQVAAGSPPVPDTLNAAGATLSNPLFRIQLDETTGGIRSLFSHELKRELVNHEATALNDFFYLPGSDAKGVKRNGKPRISVKEKGPLVSSLLVESEAPGCKRLLREVRIIAGLDRVELINTIDKLAVREKEGIHFGYGFAVPDSQVRMDVGWAMVRPEVDQIPASCKNWFSVQRWLDISNDKFGVTWSPIDAPLVELGGLTANLIGSQTDWRVWIQHLGPTQTIYSWVMNNHWHTNYRAEQEGTTVFRYAIRPHRKFSADQAARFGVECSQPLIAAPASRSIEPRLRVSSDKVLVSAFKPADSGKGWIVRLFAPADKAQKVSLDWSAPAPRQVWLSDTSERPKQKLEGRVEVPAWGIVTLRAE
jgi:hypothetical protein